MVPRESQQGNVFGNGRSSLPSRVKRVLVTVAIILCTVVRPCESYNDQLGCGKRQGDLLFTRITRGDEAVLGEWPWHSAIFSSADSKPQYICGGSIIHKNAVISSAHCFVLFNRLVHEDLINVHVGRIDLNTATDGLQVLNVSKLIPHPKFFTLNGMKYDISILKLSKDIVMSWSVHPVCVWGMADDHRELVGETGTIVGFGFNENDELSGMLKKAELTVVDVYECLDNDRETYGRVLTRNMYCAGGRTNVSACNGDSGGGMFFERNGTWYIRGIISFIAMRPNAAMCDSSKYTVFTDVGLFSDWIMESITGLQATQLSSHLPPCKGRTAPKHGTCNVAHLFDSNFVLVGFLTSITRVSLNGENNIVVSRTGWLSGLEHDCAEGRFYWSDYETEKIHSAKYDGTDQKHFIEEDVKVPGNLAVDWISRRLYWVDLIKKTIEVASLENPNVRTVLIHENISPYSIAVDPLRNKLYWVNRYGGGKIEWSNLDGTNRQVLLSHPQISAISSIKVSIATGELCYVDRGLKQIECIDPRNNQIRPVASNLTDPSRLAVTDELIYWTKWDSYTIDSINMNGVRQKPMEYPLCIYGMTAVTDNCPLRYSPCANNNGDCPENTICLVNPSAPDGKSCIVKRKCEAYESGGKCKGTVLDE